MLRYLKSKTLELILAGALTLLPPLSNAEGQNRFYKAKTNESIRQTYLQELFDSLPKTSALKINKICSGISYEPTEKELTNIATKEILETLNKNNITTNILNDLVKTSLAEYADFKNSDSRATIFPMCPWLYGKRTTEKIVFKANTFNDPSINNEADLKNVLAHETSHVVDMSLGMCLSEKNTTRLEKIDPAAFSALTELRAYYAQLKRAFFENELPSLSSGHMIQLTGRYWENYDFLKNYKDTKATKEEKEILETQFKLLEFIPHLEGNQISIRKK